MERAYRGSGNKATRKKGGMAPVASMCSGGCKATRGRSGAGYGLQGPPEVLVYGQRCGSRLPQVLLFGHRFRVLAEGLLRQLLGMHTAESRAPGVGFPDKAWGPCLSGCVAATGWGMHSRGLSEWKGLSYNGTQAP